MPIDIAQQNSVSLLSSGIEEAEKRPLYFGWAMVALSIFIQTVGLGTLIALGTFLRPIGEAFDANSFTVLGCTSGSMMLMFFFGSPVCGSFLQKYSQRKMATAGMLLMSLAYGLLASATHLWEVAAIYAFGIAVGAMLIGQACQTLIANWFITRRGRAFSAASAGVSIIACLVPPLTTKSFNTFGLQTTALIISIVILIASPFAWLLMIDRPELKCFSAGGNTHDSAPAPENGSRTILASLFPILQVLKNKRFWHIASIVGIAGAVTGTLSTNLISIAHQAGIKSQSASFLISYMTFCSAISTILIGRISDNLKQRTLAVIPLIVLSISCALMLFSPTYSTFILISVLIGLSAGAESILASMLISINFPRESFALVSGVMVSCSIAVYAICIPAFGGVFDLTGSYQKAIIGSLFALVLVSLLAFKLPVSRSCAQRPTTIRCRARGSRPSILYSVA